MIKNIIILGGQWGDEGKGKIVDLLTSQVNCVVRFQGGRNAGHIIVKDQKKINLHLVPSGILHSNVTNVIASGVAVSLSELSKELENLKKIGLSSISKRVFISELCPLVFSYHVAMDIAREKKNLSKFVIGTTGCGIGPAYEDRVARRGLRIVDLYNRKNFENRLKDVVDYYNFQLVNYYQVEPVSYHSILQEVITVVDKIINMVIDVPTFLQNINKRDGKIIFEGAQGTLLDLDYGTYPYVTATNTIASTASIGTGMSVNDFDYVFGIIKAYTTRVGNGPFPTELFSKIGNWLCEHGNEFGSTTGRIRRVGWFDAVAVRYTASINPFFSCGLTKLDILDGLSEVKICTAYRTLNGEIIHKFPCSLEKLENLTPIYETLPGWMGSTRGITVFHKLPKEAQCYIKRIEEIIEVPIDIISTGPDRLNTIVLRNFFDIYKFK